MKKLLTIMLSVLMVCGLAACSSKKEEETTTTETPATETETAEATESSELANPWVDCNDGQEAAQIAGFEFEVAESLGTDGVYRAVNGQIIEVTLGNDANVPFTFRKALGVDAADLAGDYNEYSNGGTLDVNDITVVFAGNGDDSINVAYWTIGDYSYSFSTETGIPSDVLTSYVELVK